MMSLFLRSVALVLFLSVSVMGQYARVEAFKMDFSGGGARAEGMGKAFLGVSDDNTAGSWNPAGLYGLEKPIISLSWGSLMPRGETFSTQAIVDDLTLSHDGSFGAVSSINFVSPIRIKGHPFVGSFSYTRNAEEYETYNLSNEFWSLRRHYIGGGEQYVEDSALYQNCSESELWGGLASVSFSAGTRVYNNVSVGVAVNIFMGTAVRDERTFSNCDSVVDFFTLQNVKDSYSTQVLDSNKFSGFNFTIGAKYSGEKFDIGGVIRTPFSLNVKTGKSIYKIHSINDLSINEGTDTTYYDDIMIKYDVPWIIGLGVAYRASDRLLLAADGIYRAFGNSKINIRDSVFLDPGGENTEFFTEFDPEWYSVIDLRCGGEYMMETGIGKVPVRAGLGFSPLIRPASDIDINYNREKHNTYSYSLSLGTGIWWEQIHLDCAYTYSFYDFTTDYIGNRGIESFDLKKKDHHFNLMFTGYF